MLKCGRSKKDIGTPTDIGERGEISAGEADQQMSGRLESTNIATERFSLIIGNKPCWAATAKCNFSASAGPILGCPNKRVGVGGAILQRLPFILPWTMPDFAGPV